MTILIKALQLILSLSILVIIHELGHFAFARLFNTRVEKFRLFFDPWFAIWKKKIGETEYGIGWIPLGGYVKISGMIDESMDTEQLKQPEQPWEFRSKPSWQRLLIMLGGVMFNIILAYLIYTAVLWNWGEKYLPVNQMEYGVACSQTAKNIGFENGDKIISIGDQKAEDFFEIFPDIFYGKSNRVTVERDGKLTDVLISSDDRSKIIQDSKTIFFTPRIPFVISQFSIGSPAEKAGLKANDKIVAVNNDTLAFYDQIVSKLAALKAAQVKITILRDASYIDYSVTLDDNGKLGVYSYSPSKYFEYKTRNYSIFAAIPAGITKGTKTVKDYIQQVKMIFTPKTKAYESLGGFIAIGNIFPSVWDWEAFWNLTAFLSIILAVMNILPIPALDGGHVIILLYEMITKRKPSEKFLEYTQIAGFVIILVLVLYANLNDVFRLFK